MKKLTISVFISLVLIFSSTTAASVEAVYSPNISPESKYIFMINTDTNTVVYERDQNERAFPASTTKIMTAILTIENCLELRDTSVTVPKSVMDSLRGVDSSMAGFKADEQLKMIDLLYGLLLPSGNECALTLAHYFGDGDISKFVDQMNSKAQELGMKNTNFVNPNGLHDDNHYTTAYDTYIMAKYALQYPIFKEICGSFKYTIFETNLQKKRTIYNTNYLLDRNKDYYLGAVKGIKTGRTNQSGNCLVSTATKNGYTYICVVMGAPLQDKNGKKNTRNIAFDETKSLYDWAFKDLGLKEIVTENQIITEIPLKNAWNKDHIALVPEKSYNALIPITVDSSTVIIEYDVEESISAPVKKGDRLGQAIMKYGTQEIGRVDLVAVESVDRNFLLYSAGFLWSIVKSKPFIITVSVLILLVAAYIIYAYSHNRKIQKIKNQRKNDSYSRNSYRY